MSKFPSDFTPERQWSYLITRRWYHNFIPQSRLKYSIQYVVHDRDSFNEKDLRMKMGESTLWDELDGVLTTKCKVIMERGESPSNEIEDHYSSYFYRLTIKFASNKDAVAFKLTAEGQTLG